MIKLCSAVISKVHSWCFLIIINEKIYFHPVLFGSIFRRKTIQFADFFGRVFDLVCKKSHVIT